MVVASECTAIVTWLACADFVIRLRLAARAPPPPDFVALRLLRLLSRGRMQYAVCEFEMSFGMFVTSSLKVLRISCKFYDSSLQVLCKFLAISLLQDLCRCSALFLVSGALGEYQNFI